MLKLCLSCLFYALEALHLLVLPFVPQAPLMKAAPLLEPLEVLGQRWQWGQGREQLSALLRPAVETAAESTHFDAEHHVRHCEMLSRHKGLGLLKPLLHALKALHVSFVAALHQGDIPIARHGTRRLVDKVVITWQKSSVNEIHLSGTRGTG